MSTATYSLTLPTNIFAHLPLNVLTLHDGEEINRQELNACVRSGDYFIMLATLLETIAQDLAENDTSTALPVLQRLVSDLEYVQAHYGIVKRASED